MAALPIAPVERIIRKAGAERISQEACETLASIMESYSIDLSERSVQLAKHAKRKTVRSDDVKLAARGFNE